MENKTLVLDIKELYETVPGAKVLEGKNFKDVRQLLKELIAAVEESGEWQFIQYVQNKPSLFVVRKLEVIETVVPEVSKSDIQKLEEKLNVLGSALHTVSVAKGLTHEKLVETVEVVKEAAKTSIYDNPIFEAGDPKTTLGKDNRLPWERED